MTCRLTALGVQPTCCAAAASVPRSTMATRVASIPIFMSFPSPTESVSIAFLDDSTGPTIAATDTAQATIMSVHDFRSDTVTLPTPEMMAAVAAAPLGDSARGDDPTVNELERLAGALTGKDDALFVPSGTMANLAAVIAHECRGGEVIVEESAHIYNSEGGGLSVVAGAIPRPVRGSTASSIPYDVKAAIGARPTRPWRRRG